MLQAGIVDPTKVVRAGGRCDAAASRRLRAGRPGPDKDPERWRDPGSSARLKRWGIECGRAAHKRALGGLPKVGTGNRFDMASAKDARSDQHGVQS